MYYPSGEGPKPRYTCSQSNTDRAALVAGIVNALPPDAAAKIESGASMLCREEDRRGLGRLGMLELLLKTGCFLNSIEAGEAAQQAT